MEGGLESFTLRIRSDPGQKLDDGLYSGRC